MHQDRSRGSGLTLRFQPTRADKERMTSVRAHGDERASAARSRERGQAMVEFALLAPVFLLIMGGIIHFGVALNFWLDMNRISNQGARWVAVNCNQSAVTPPANPCLPDIETALAQDLVSQGNNATVEVCWVETSGNGGSTPTVGDPVRVQLSSNFNLIPFVGTGNIRLRATTTMRLEQEPSPSGPLATVPGPAPGTACPT